MGTVKNWRGGHKVVGGKVWTEEWAEKKIVDGAWGSFYGISEKLGMSSEKL